MLWAFGLGGGSAVGGIERWREQEFGLGGGSAVGGIERWREQEKAWGRGREDIGFLVAQGKNTDQRFFIYRKNIGLGPQPLLPLRYIPCVVWR